MIDYDDDDGQQTLPYGHKNIVAQTAVSIADSSDNAAAVKTDPTDDDNLEKWMPFSKIVNSQYRGIVTIFRLNNSLTLKTLFGTIRKLMMTTLRIVLLLKIHNHIVRFNNGWNRSIAAGKLQTPI